MFLSNKELFDIAEETIFDSLLTGEEKSIALTNYNKCVQKFYSSYVKAELLSEKVCDGEVVDEGLLAKTLQELLIYQTFARQFKKEFFGNEELFSPEASEMEEETKEQLLSSARQMLEQFQETKNPLFFEKGQYFAAKADTGQL